LARLNSVNHSEQVLPCQIGSLLGLKQRYSTVPETVANKHKAITTRLRFIVVRFLALNLIGEEM
jgi:hypothetical protein